MRKLILIFCTIFLLFGCNGEQDNFSGKWDDLSGNHDQLIITKVGKITYLISLGDNQWRAELKDSVLVYSTSFGEGYARVLDSGDFLELQGEYHKVTKYQNHLITEKQKEEAIKIAAEKEKRRVELEKKLAKEREKQENSFSVSILPESKDFTISNFEYLIGNFKPGKLFMITVLGEKFNGSKYTKKIIFTTPSGGGLKDIGLELRKEEKDIFVDNIIFASVAEKAGIDFDQKILNFQY